MEARAMRYKIASLAAAAIAFGGVQMASAADMAVKARPMVAPVTTYTWTGCYIGVNAGAGWSRSSFDSVMDPGTHLGLAANVAAVSAAGTGSARDDGNFIGGGQIGCNWQTGSWVIGIEGDFDAFRADPTLVGTGVLTTGDTFVITNSVTTNWLATVRPRLGWAFDRSLLYITGGLAVTNIKYTQTYADTLFAAAGTSSSSQTKAGWTIGGGWEYAFTNNWSMKAEYLFVHFSSVSTGGIVVSTSGGTNALSGTADLREHIARIGLNYRF
jgi:outer membrane immunogenic protein